MGWHPSEATALLTAAARGVRGTVEVRDAGLKVELTEASAALYRLPISDALRTNSLVAHLADTTTIEQVEDITREHCGFCEIDYERTKQERTISAPERSGVSDLDAAIRAFEHDALTRGVDYVTFRRIAEAIGPARVDIPAMRRHLLATRPDHYE